MAIYAASKATILSVTRSFAHALADRGVRVNAICPAILDGVPALGRGGLLTGQAVKFTGGLMTW